MAQIFPSFENIERLKVSPTEGEAFLLNYLATKFKNDVEIYYQPFLNGDRPDIILMHKDLGVTIIEVKDWDLCSYRIDKNNKWYVKKINQIIRSPFQQVFNYKNNLFNLHINGLLEKKIKNKNFYRLINVYVYFHNQSKLNIGEIYKDPISEIYQESKSHHNKYKQYSSIEKKEKYMSYENKRQYLEKKKKTIERDMNVLTCTQENLDKISLPFDSGNNIFDIGIYY